MAWTSMPAGVSRPMLTRSQPMRAASSFATASAAAVKRRSCTAVATRSVASARRASRASRSAGLLPKLVDQPGARPVDQRSALLQRMLAAGEVEGHARAACPRPRSDSRPARLPRAASSTPRRSASAFSAAGARYCMLRVASGHVARRGRPVRLGPRRGAARRSRGRPTCRGSRASWRRTPRRRARREARPRRRLGAGRDRPSPGSRWARDLPWVSARVTYASVRGAGLVAGGALCGFVAPGAFGFAATSPKRGLRLCRPRPARGPSRTLKYAIDCTWT